MLVTQDITRDINNRNNHHSVVVKLNMAKVYDKVSWIYLTKVMRRFGFWGRMIDMVWRLVSNNLYSIMVNRQPYGFFKSTRSLKQGDPIFPTLFIIEAEILVRGFNNLKMEKEYIGFVLPKWNEQLNHLCYANKINHFCSGYKVS